MGIKDLDSHGIAIQSVQPVQTCRGEAQRAKADPPAQLNTP